MTLLCFLLYRRGKGKESAGREEKKENKAKVYNRTHSLAEQSEKKKEIICRSDAIIALLLSSFPYLWIQQLN